MTGTEDSSKPDKSVLVGQLHQALMAALLQREKDIIQYLAILVPALGGFMWLLIEFKKFKPCQSAPCQSDIFIYGTIGVLLLLLLGAVYALTLGYNFRYITLQLAKLESRLRIEGMMLVSWPRSPDDFARKCRIGIIPWCTPPEMIKVFWIAFVLGIAGVTVAACLFLYPRVCESTVWQLAGTGTGALVVALLAPIHFGRKLRAACKKEPLVW
jgi:hypothetical protein